MYLALEPAGAGQLDGGREIPVERTSSPYDVVEAFSGLAETSEQIDTDQLAESLTTLADLTRNTPEEFRGALDGVSRALGQHRRPRRADQHAARNLEHGLRRPRRPRPGHRRADEGLRRPVPGAGGAPRGGAQPAGLDLARCPRS